jgi:signal transduction histidine kinase
MAKAQARSDEVARKYTAALKQWLGRGGEAVLQRAYAIGRSCLADGWSILDMVSIHHAAVQAMGKGAAPGCTNPETFRKANEFFIESLSPFEMTHRAFGEGNRALRRLNETLEEQNRHIAREIHDCAGQLLAAVHIELDGFARETPSCSLSRLNKIKGLLDQVEKQLRGLSHELRPAILEDLGLSAALEFLSSRVEKRTGLRIALQSLNEERLPGRIEVALYRIIQEALNNIAKHSQATRAKIRLQKSAKAVMCSVSDNGIGFDPRSMGDSSGLGLLGIQERLQALQGHFRIESGVGKGTRLKIKVPLE